MNIHSNLKICSLLARALADNAITLRALIVREIMIRYKREGLGFAWLVIEPMLLTVMVMVMWRLLYGDTKNGIGVLPLVLTGYSFLTMWRHIVGRSVFILKLGFDLKYHRAIQYGDIIISKYMLEFLAVQLAFWIVYMLLLGMYIISPVYDISLVVGSWILLAFLLIGLGMIVVSVTELFESAERYISPLMYVTIPLTGAFFMVSWMPYSIQEVLLWSPMVHAVEMFRAGFFGPRVPTHYDASYLFFCGLIANGLGWALFDVAKTRVEPLT